MDGLLNYAVFYESKKISVSQKLIYNRRFSLLYNYGFRFTYNNIPGSFDETRRLIKLAYLLLPKTDLNIADRKRSLSQVIKNIYGSKVANFY